MLILYEKKVGFCDSSMWKNRFVLPTFQSEYSDLLQGEDEANMNTFHYIYTFYIILLYILYWHALYMHTYILHLVTACCTVCRCSTARLSAGVCCGLTSSNVLDWIPAASSLPDPLSPLGTSQPLGSLQASKWESRRWANTWVAWQHSAKRQKEEESEHKKGGNSGAFQPQEWVK